MPSCCWARIYWSIWCTPGLTRGSAMTTERRHGPDPGPVPGHSRSPAERAWLRFRSDHSALAGLVVLGLLIALLVGSVWLSTHDPNQLTDAQLAPPSAGHWLG